MGKTHLSGLELGDPGVGVWSAVQAAQRIKLTALNTGSKLDFPEGALITGIYALDGAGVLVAATVNIGTTATGNEIGGGAVTAGSPLAINKSVSPAQKAYVSASAGAVPLTVYVLHIPGPPLT